MKAIKAWTKAHAPELHKIIGKPAPSFAIKKLRKEVPNVSPDYVAWLEIMNGQSDADNDAVLGLIPAGDYPFYVYNIKRVVETFGSDIGLARDKRKPKSSPAIQPVWFDLEWIEFASDGDTALAIDPHPTKKGKVGQIIQFGYDSPKRRVLWNSFSELLGDLANCYRNDSVTWENGLLKRKKSCAFPDLGS